MTTVETRSTLRSSNRPAFGTAAWHARSKCSDVRFALARARERADEARRYAEVVRAHEKSGRGWPFTKSAEFAKAFFAAATKDAASRSKRAAGRVCTLEAQLIEAEQAYARTGAGNGRGAAVRARARLAA
jgi:hypothetical protein